MFVADLRPDRHQATVAALAELREHLESYGRKLEDVPLVVQYNHRDQADENAVERLHRLIPLRQASCFEARADEGTGVLQTLTTLSKLLLVELRKTVDDVATPLPRSIARTPRAGEARAVEAIDRRAARPADRRRHRGLRRRARALPRRASRSRAPDRWTAAASEIRIPVRLIDEATGRRVEIVVRVAIDAL